MRGGGACTGGYKRLQAVRPASVAGRGFRLTARVVLYTIPQTGKQTGLLHLVTSVGALAGKTPRETAQLIII